MYKLIALYFPIVVTSFRVQVPAQHTYLLTDRTDSATVVIFKNKDTTRFDIQLVHNKKKVRYNYTLIEQLKNKISPFLFVGKDVNGKLYKMPLKDSIFYAKKTGSRKLTIYKMINEHSAFIYNGTTRYKCLTFYRLQKNSSAVQIRMTYSPTFGLLNLYLDTQGEETDDNNIIKKQFSLKLVDGKDARDYLKSLCNKK